MFDFVYCFRLNTFTSKISDLLLPLEAEGARVRESYPPSDTTNKYIYDAFFCYDDLCMFLLLLLFFHFLIPQRS